MDEILAIIGMSVNSLDDALARLLKVELKDPEQLDRLNSIREELNDLLTEMKDEHYV